MNAKAKVLYHPCFGQSAVVNPVIRGRRPKSIVSIVSVREKRDMAERRNRVMDLQARDILHTPESLLNEWIEDVQNNLIRIEAFTELQRRQVSGRAEAKA